MERGRELCQLGLRKAGLVVAVHARVCHPPASLRDLVQGTEAVQRVVGGSAVPPAVQAHRQLVPVKLQGSHDFQPLFPELCVVPAPEAGARASSSSELADLSRCHLSEPRRVEENALVEDSCLARD